MEIWLRKKRFNSSGESFSAPYEHLDRIIANKLIENNITFPFNEIDIELVYNIESDRKNDKFNQWFKKLPHYYRGKNMIRVSIAAQDEAEYLENIFNLIISSFEILLEKKKKTDDYNSVQVMDSLLELKQEMSQLDLWQLHTKYENILRQERIEKNLQNRKDREIAKIENKRLIKDIRLSDTFGLGGKSSFMPYSLQFCDKITIKLRKVKFRLPNYDHLYIKVSDSFENAIYDTVTVYAWYVYGVAIFENYETFESLKEEGKKRVVFDLIKQGLYDIAKIDKLDILTLDKVLVETEKEIFQ